MGLDTVDLIVKIETAFNISVPNERWASIDLVQDIYTVVEEYTRGRSVNRPEIVLRVNAILGIQSGYNVDAITPSMSITNDLGLD